jgi:hypothetical protein
MPDQPMMDAETCPKCGNRYLNVAAQVFLCGSYVRESSGKFVQVSACRIRELERTLAARDAEIERLKGLVEAERNITRAGRGLSHCD